jgi:hypothetical protein
MEGRMSISKRTGSLTGLGIALACLFAGAPASAAIPNCTLVAVTALGVPNMTITSVTDVSGPPEYCRVLGFVTTSGFDAPKGSAGFEVRLPATQ